jgi:hypothetical protein
VQKTRAHRTQKQAEEQGDLPDYLGNQAADKAANRGAQVYHGPQDEVQRAAEGLRDAKAMVVWTAQRAAKQWVAAPFEARGRVPKEGADRRNLRAGGCQWLNCGDGQRSPMWACEVCGRWSRLPLSKRRKLGPCRGRTTAVQAASLQGHCMASWAILNGKWEGRTLHGCTKCAATAMVHFVHLKQRCPGRPRGHQEWVARQLQEGRHPNGKDLVAILPRRRARRARAAPKQDGVSPPQGIGGQEWPVQGGLPWPAGPCPPGVANSRAPDVATAPQRVQEWEDLLGPDAPACSEDEQADCFEPPGACEGPWAEPPEWAG